MSGLIILLVATPFIVLTSSSYSSQFNTQATILDIANNFRLDTPLIYIGENTAQLSNFGQPVKLIVKVNAIGCINENKTSSVLFESGITNITLPSSCSGTNPQTYTISLFGTNNLEYASYTVVYFGSRVLSVENYAPSTTIKINNISVVPVPQGTTAYYAFPTGQYNVTVYNSYYYNSGVSQLTSTSAANLNILIPKLVTGETKQLTINQVVNGKTLPLSLAKVSINYNSSVATSDSSGIASFPYMSNEAQLNISCPLTTCAGAGTSVSNNYTSINGNFNLSKSTTYTLYPLYRTNIELYEEATTNASNPTVIKTEVPITITNSQSVATASPYQQLINISESSYPEIKYNGNFANFEFLYSNNTVIPAWIELNSSGKLIVYMKLNQLQPDSQETIYLGIANSTTNILSSSGTSGIGEAPLLSTTYAEYDDGNSVFNFYTNFAGTTISSALSSFGNVTIDNGATLTGISSGTYNYGTINYEFTMPSSNKIIVDVYGKTLETGRQRMYLTTTESPVGYNGYFSDIGHDYGIFGQTEITSGDLTYYWNGSFEPDDSSFAINVPYITQYVLTGSTFYFNILSSSGQSIASQSTTEPSTTNVLSLIDDDDSGSTKTTYYWINTLSYPPNGIMPSYVFGQPQTVSIVQKSTVTAPTSGVVNFISTTNSSLNRNIDIGASGTGVVWLPSGNYDVSAVSFSNLVNTTTFDSTIQNQTDVITFKTWWLKWKP